MQTQSKPSQILKKIIQFLIYGLIFALPLYFLPTTSNVFEFNKQYLLITVTLVILILWAVKMVFDKKITIRKSPFDLPLLLLLLIFTIATLFSQNRLVSLFGLSGVLHWNFLEVIALYFLYYIISSNLVSPKEVKTAIFSLIASILLLSAVNLLSYFSILKPAFMGGIPLNPAGSPTNLTILIITALILSTGLFFQYLNSLKVTKEKGGQPTQENKIFVVAFIYSLYAIILLLTFFLISPLTASLASKVTKVDYPLETTLELRASWNIAMDTFQNVPLLGSGPSTFLFDYNRFRPQYLNNTIYWDSHFNKPANEYLLLLSEIGLLGVLAFIFLPIKTGLTLLKVFGQQKAVRFNSLLIGSALVLFVLLIFTFSTTLSAFLMILLLGLATVSLLEIKLSEEVILSFSILREGIVSFGNLVNEKVALKKGGFFQSKPTSSAKEEKTEALPWVFLVISVIISLISGYYLTRFLIAEVSYRKALVAINENDGIKTYDNLQRAITYNPYRDLYRNTYAQTSLLLAGSIANNTKELSDQDKNNIQQLLQQAVREIRIVTENLVPQNSGNWELRGRVYRQLIGVAQDAESWSIGAYNTAINLDPNNARLRVDLGGIYYQMKNYTQAIVNFQNAALLKGDYVNAYYNLSAAYKEDNKIEQAIAAMQQVVTLLPQDNPDYDKANKELEELKKLMPEEKKEATESAE